MPTEKDNPWDGGALLMRTVLVLLLVTFFVLPAAAQDGATWNVEDSEDDQEADGEVPYPGATWGAADITAASLAETEETLQVSVTSADLSLASSPAAPAQAARFIVAFQVGGAGYEARLEPVIDGQAWFLVLYKEEGGQWTRGPTGDVTVEGDTVSAEVPRDWLADPDGQAINPLTPVTGLHARSQSILRPGLSDEIRLNGVGDRAPDDVAGDGAIDPVFGMEQTGPLQVTSPRPFRASNGLATTYAVQATVTDTRSAGDTEPVHLTVADTPPDWSVQVLPEILQSAPGDQNDIILLVGVPDRHQHGVVEGGGLVVEAPGQGWRSLLEFGVSYVDPPLPSGHHPELFVHAMQGGASFSIYDDRYFEYTQPFLSTALEDPRAVAGDPPVGYGCDDYTRQEELEVCATAAVPVLAGDLGLVRGEGPAPVSLQVVWPENLAPQAADARARLLWATHWDSFDGFPDDAQVLWQRDWEALDVAGDRALLEADLAAVDGPDRFEPQDGGTLWLSFDVRTADPAAQFHSRFLTDVPRIASGSTVHLPLGEYHDAIAEIVGDQAFRIHAPAVVDVAQDAVSQVQFHLVDRTDSATDVRVEVGGPAAKWVIGDPDVDFAGGEGTVTLRMRADSGSIGQRSSLALAVHDHATGITGATTVPVQVVDASQVEADEGVSQDTPGLGAVALVGLLVVALVRRR